MAAVILIVKHNQIDINIFSYETGKLKLQKNSPPYEAS